MMRTGWRHTLHSRRAMAGMVFLLPWLAGLLIFTAVPLVYSIWLSVCRVDFTTEGMHTAFVGGQWYIEALQKDPYFFQHLLDTVKFIAFLTPMILVVSVLFALLLNTKLRGRTVFRALFFFPVVFINGPVMDKLIGNDATAIIKPEQYAVYQIVATLPDVISVPLLYIFDNVVLILWFSGIQILITLAGLQKVNASLYEAASIDGASPWQIFWKITLPCLRPMLLVSAVYTIVDLAGFSNNAITVYIQKNLNVTTKPYAYSAAMSWIYALAVLVLLLIAFQILRERREKR